MLKNQVLDSYQTIAAPAKGVFKEKSSKFFAFAYPVSNEDTINEHLLELRKKYFDARHHCFAYRLGIDGIFWRVNDDGEPPSSAGKPILGQLLSFQVSDILVVVVRYFGGTKLGIPGLINAYRRATADALNQSVIVPKFITVQTILSFPYSQMNNVMKVLKDFSDSVLSQEFLSCDNLSHHSTLPHNCNCTLSLSIRSSRFSSLLQILSNIPQLIITQ